MEKNTLIALGASSLIGLSGLAYQQINKSDIEDIYSLKPEQAITLQGKKFTSEKQGNCESGTYDPKLSGDAQYVSCVRTSESGEKVYAGAIFGDAKPNTVNSTKLKEFRLLATTRGYIHNDSTKDQTNKYYSYKKGDFNYTLEYKYDIKDGNETYLYLNNCESKSTIANLQVNAVERAKNGHLFCVDQTYGYTDTGKLCSVVFNKEEAIKNGYLKTK